MNVKKNYQRAAAMFVAGELMREGAGCAEPGFMVVTGSNRRERPKVHDLEFLYIPQIENRKVEGDFFANNRVNLMDKKIEELIGRGVLVKRPSVTGTLTYGPSNKLMTHVCTGLPVDFFATNRLCWWNRLVCTTGSRRHNIIIAQAAKKKCFTWNPYGAGFRRDSDGEVVAMESERAVFEFCGLAWLEPWERI